MAASGAPMQRTVLRAGSLGLRYGTREVFRGLDISLDAGQVLAVTGPNGSGKSSLLRVLAGLTEPTSGTLSLPPRRERGLAALDQNLYPALTVAEHVSFIARLHGMAAPALGPFGLEVQRSQVVGHLSSGQRSRLKFLLATLHTPTLLLLDEPSVGLDTPGCEVLAKVVESQRERGATVLATNDQEDVACATHRLELAG